MKCNCLSGEIYQHYEEDYKGNTVISRGVRHLAQLHFYNGNVIRCPNCDYLLPLYQKEHLMCHCKKEVGLIGNAVWVVTYSQVDPITLYEVELN